MSKATLVIMAAGIGSRFGGGIKQLTAVGPSGEIMIDYSIYDAKAAGFDKVIFVIRKDLEADFKEVIGNRMEQEIEVAYAYQEVTDIPKAYRERFQDRTKPWGTGQAILCCKELIKEPFLVINADDYYGKSAYKKAYEYLTAPQEPQEDMQLSMVGFILKNTLSDHGGVTRGVCKIDEQGMLTGIQETHGIVKRENHAMVTEERELEYEIDVESPVSMNMWGLCPEFLTVLEVGFEKFLSEIDNPQTKEEYLLPTIIGELLKQQKVQVKVLQSTDKWIGVTYKEDKEAVIKAIKELVNTGVYPEKLFNN
ncbi:MAG: sugar phosphate nucleotidyltransferase [Lachnospiraceae bacterium]